MKFNYLVTLLILLPLYTFSQTKNGSQTLPLPQNEDNKNTEAFSYSNESDSIKKMKAFTRSTDYPTQIIRMKADVENQLLNCKQVNEQIDKVVVQNIIHHEFTYAIYINCHYNPENGLATEFTINSYFDPLSDDAINYLNTYLAQYNGSDLLGTKLNIESAKGLIISLGIAVGMRKIPAKPPFVEYRKDRSNFYFKSNYEMKHKLIADIEENFFSNDPERVLPFLDKWIFYYAGSMYKAILSDSNYVELQPERIFLMGDNGDIFVSGLKQYFVHQCDKYENHRCLKPT